MIIVWFYIYRKSVYDLFLIHLFKYMYKKIW